MTGPSQDKDSSVGTPVPKQKSKATIDTLGVGCIAMVQKDGALRRAEILSIKETKSGRQFYCNFDNFNKRLDEWVPAIRIDFTQDVEWPAPEKPKEKSKAPPAGKKTIVGNKKNQKRPTQASKREDSVVSESGSNAPPWSEFAESQRQTPDADGDAKLTMALDLDATPEANDPMDVDEAATEAANAKNEPAQQFSPKEEIEKLRTSGSMTQNQAEISRIRNISKVQFGKFELYPWYFSPYPEAFTQEDLMYICEFCLSYYGDLKAFTRHRGKCTLQHPPGNEIYRDDYVSFFEIDGRRQRTWCRNLCLISKMFLDHKTLYYDVDPFLFYVMCSRDEKGFHLVGYFSKEKESADGYNVACILTLPQYQRKGYGRLLINFSYELSKIEGKLGSPEKPLSDLGLLSYRQYWTERIVEELLIHNEKDERISIEGLSQKLNMTSADVEHTLQALKMQVYHKGEHKMVLPTALIKRHEAMREKQKLKPKRVIDPSRIVWKPFKLVDRTWGW
ncbi:Bcesa1 [Botrytis cinerea B05.10]|uniref:histone acetyltransferase n=3 Tax=Botryotinia fuckeliana TaxID=40559 RepID=A0A384K0H9_BOTFB|nr:Bcesa1 [Botrytis cinerea B05.10]ATZ56134.1 Bcesa1 [Botrytis cinerea B05.10]EMR88708.1 putative histone acetyltransferase esa1 protein [Botrytis cinerea BcDW1]CCD33729.1 similar to histone acetyltransferase esa1 [Botrytis cinerea T4]